MAFKTKYLDLLAYAQKKYKELDVILSTYTTQFLRVSPQLATVLGYTQKEMEDKSLRELVVMGPVSASAMINSLLEEKSRRSVTMKSKDGNRVKLVGTGAPFTYQKEPYLAHLGVSSELKKQ